MRTLIVLGVLACALGGRAAADTAEQKIRALVAHHVSTLATSDRRQLAKDFTSDAEIVSDVDPEPAPGNVGFGEGKASIKGLAVGVDDKNHVGWFHVVAAVAVEAQGMQPEMTVGFRANGIVVDDHGWKLQFVRYTRPIEDAQLTVEHRDPRYAESLRVFDDEALGLQVAKWFTDGGLARDAAAANLVVSGSAVGEYAAGAGVAKYVAAWSKIAFGVSAIQSKQWGNGAIAYVRATTDMPWKTGTSALKLGAVVVRNGERWRWVSLQWEGR